MYLFGFHNEHTARYQTTHLYQGLEVALHIFRRCLENREGAECYSKEFDFIDELLKDIVSWIHQPFVYQETYDLEDLSEIRVEIVYEIDRLGHQHLSCWITDDYDSVGWAKLDYYGQSPTSYPDLPNDWRETL